MQVNDFVSIDEDFELNGDLTLNELHASHLTVGGEITGNENSLLNGYHLATLVETHLSRNFDQNISEPVRFATVTIRNGFDANTINGYDFQHAVNIIKNLKTNEQLLNATEITIDEMIVNGNVSFERLNGYDIEYIKQNAINLDQPNVIDFPIVFLNPVYINGNMNVGQLNGEPFDAFVNDLVRKSANTTRISGTVIFEESVMVHDIDTKMINSKSIDKLLTRNYNKEIVNPVEIHGNVFVPNLIIEGELNGANAQNLNAYSYDEPSDTFYLQKNVVFNESIHISYFNWKGGYKNIMDVEQHLKDLIRTDRPAKITGTKRFTDSVHIESDIDIIHYDDVNVPEFLSKIILIDQKQPVEIYSNVTFEDPVEISNLRVRGDLITSTINNCSIADWVERAIRLDQPFTFNGTVIFPPGTFDATNIETKSINGHSVDEILTLNTPQYFNEHVRIQEVHSTVPITGPPGALVAGYDLKQERANTLMVRISI